MHSPYLEVHSSLLLLHGLARIQRATSGRAEKHQETHFDRKRLASLPCVLHIVYHMFFDVRFGSREGVMPDPHPGMDGVSPTHQVSQHSAA